MPQSIKRNPFKATIIAAALAVLPLAAQAAGLGKITVLSALGQPLKAELEVTASNEEVASLSARVASREAFRQAGVEYAPALEGLRFSREIKERGGRRYIELTTDWPLNEPFIDMLVELNWASCRLVREYTFLLDPPELQKAVPIPAPVAPPAVRAEPETKPSARAGEPTAQPRAVTAPSGPVAREAAAKASASGTRTVADRKSVV